MIRDKSSGHYQKKDVQDIIKRFSAYNGALKAGVFDNKGWYRYGGDKRRLINLVDDEDYQYLVNKLEKRLLGTLNYFRPSLFQEWQRKPWDVAESLGGLEDTMYYMLSIDVDLVNDYTVNNIKALEALQVAAKFIEQDLSNVISDKFLILFSGNGIYFHLHPEFAASDETIDAVCEQRATELQNILDSFNQYIQTLEMKLFQECPEVHGIVKVDAINNRKRMFKLPMTRHKDLPYLVYPIEAKNIQIQLKTIPLSENEIEKAAKSINGFFDKIPSSEERKQLGTLLATYKPKEVNSKAKSNELQELPPVPIPIDVIKEEKICSKMFEHESWPKGNTRRVAFMTTVLRRSGWKKRTAKKFVMETAIDWKVGALEHVIDSWMDFNPPNVETIYSIGSDYPEMTMGDLGDYLPPEPEYFHVMQEIFRIAEKKGYAVPINNQSNSKGETRNVELKYKTQHLSGFRDLAAATSLFGKEYTIIFKVLWYTLLSLRMAISNIKVGHVTVDGRVSPLFVLPAGRGKGQIKAVIKHVVEAIKLNYGEPTSFHAEQLWVRR